MITNGRSCVTMRAMPHLHRIPRMAAFALLIAMGALSACSSDGKTVVALTINSDDAVGMVDQITITATGEGRTPVTTMLTPRAQPDSGVIVGSFYTRIELDGWSGKANLKVDAIRGGATVATKSTDVMLEEHGAVAARVSLSGKPPAVDSGAPETGASADGGADAE